MFIIIIILIIIIIIIIIILLIIIILFGPFEIVTAYIIDVNSTSLAGDYLNDRLVPLTLKINQKEPDTLEGGQRGSPSLLLTVQPKTGMSHIIIV